MKSTIVTAFVLIVLCLQASSQKKLFDYFQNTNQRPSNDLLIFFSQDCQWCKAADNEIRGNKTIQAGLVAQYNVRLMDISTANGKATAEKFGISAVPAFV